MFAISLQKTWTKCCSISIGQADMFSPVFIVDGRRRKKYPYCTRLAMRVADGWNLATASLSNGKYFHPWGVRGGHEVGVEVDNCQESGSVRVQGHSRATPTSICVLCTATVHHHHASVFVLQCIVLRWGTHTYLTPHGIGLWHHIALHCMDGLYCIALRVRDRPRYTNTYIQTPSHAFCIVLQRISTQCDKMRYRAMQCIVWRCIDIGESAWAPPYRCPVRACAAVTLISYCRHFDHHHRHHHHHHTD